MTTSAPPRRPVRIANCSGFYGDRLSAMAEVLRGGDVDVITGDYLAEVTMLVLAKNRLKDPSSGYARTFLTQIDPLLEEIAARSVKIVVNAGGLNPAGLAATVRDLCAKRQVMLNVAHVEGDDVLDRLDDLQAAGHRLEHLDTGKPLTDWGTPPLTANAYLGAWGIVAALKAGADIVICPRVTDASVIVGPAIWWHDWAMDDWDRLAGAVVAGHIIECGTQATGGNYSGFAKIPDMIRPGFPLAEIDADGSCVITKHAGTGGAVTTGTVTAQLLYEIQGLDYLNPDVTVQLDTIRLEDCDDNCVRVIGTRGAPPPATTKVAMTALGGFENSMMFVLTGLDRDKKAKLVEDGFRALLQGASIDELRFDHIGGLSEASGDQLGVTSLLRVSVKGAEHAVGRAFFDASVELGLASYPGLFSLRTGSRAANAYGVYWPGMLPQSVLEHEAVLADGTRIAAPQPPATSLPREPVAKTPSDAVFGATRAAALGELFDARSGDKGGNANVGLWARDDAGYRWLEAELTPDVIRELLPETRELIIERHDLPNLRAVNFVVRGLLGGGATETLRFDSQAKALGEYVRSKVVELPVALLSRNAATL
ncbi:Protein of unknown function [Sphingomonas sp. OV641]|uniref:acyclic terpene utilization AtuA family protein n=1 Tax=Sphingomonas sp. OV641 TaxID=1881068 RepID=UPI0008BFF9BD|nr:acyclic terpene utilization AtuA family protein [Sphingomonas sp. OV641]SEK03738.1 Protein of unknown function [Sphingomonas sp. OV641]